jgi:hypothetical protein
MCGERLGWDLSVRAISVWRRALQVSGRAGRSFSMLSTVPSSSRKCHRICHEPCKSSPILITAGWDNRRDSLEITDLRRFLRLHGMQEVQGLRHLR